MLETITILAAAAETAHEGGAIAELAGKFGIDGKLIFAQAINFIVVAFLLWKFAFKPVMGLVTMVSELVVRAGLEEVLAASFDWLPAPHQLIAGALLLAVAMLSLRMLED